MNLFSKFKKQTLGLSTTEVIQKIHNEFNNASEEALREAKIILANIKNTDREKAALLNKLGFANTGEALKVSRVEAQEREAKNRALVVEKYQQKYPQYKFIFWDQVESICKKYNLVCGKSSLYKGDIPMKNLKEIDAFSVKPEDVYYTEEFRHSFMEQDKETPSKAKNWVDHTRIKIASPFYKDTYRNYKLPFFICAPLKDMATKGTELKGSFLQREIPDPIVLHPMKDGALIVSKWGLEAEDEMVVNQKMN